MILIFVIDIMYCTIIFLSLVQKKFKIKNKSFLEDLSKGFELKSVYTTKGKLKYKILMMIWFSVIKKLMMFFIKK